MLAHFPHHNLFLKCWHVLCITCRPVLYSLVAFLMVLFVLMVLVIVLTIVFVLEIAYSVWTWCSAVGTRCLLLTL